MTSLSGYTLSGRQEFYSPNMVWFKFQYPTFDGLEVTLETGKTYCTINYCALGGRPGDDPDNYSVLGISISLGESELRPEANALSPNVHGVKFERIVKNKLRQGVVFEDQETVTMAMIHNKIALEFSDYIFQQAIETFQKVEKDEITAKEIVQAHIDQHNIFYAMILQAHKIGEEWFVRTKQHPNETTYKVDLAKKIIISSQITKWPKD